MTIKQLTNADGPLVRQLMSEAFSLGARQESEFAPQEPDTPLGPSLVLGSYEGDRLVATAEIHHLHLSWGEGIVVPMGGVAGVACTASSRGRGHVARLLRESLQSMRDAGEYLSGLYPFSFSFYRRFGWDWVGRKVRYKVPLEHVRSFPQGQYVKSYDAPSSIDLVKPVYQVFASRYRSMTTREDAEPNWWQSGFTHRDNKTTYLHVYHDPVSCEAQGFFTFRYSHDSGSVGDFFANTPDAYMGLVSILHYYKSQIPRVEFSAPIDDILPLYVMHRDLKVEQAPLFMGRIVDVAKALEALRLPDATIEASVQVLDEECPWNQGYFKIMAGPGGVQCEKTGVFTSGVQLDIQALSQAYWGFPTISMLRAAGRLTVTDESSFTGLAKLFNHNPAIPDTPYLADFF